MSDYTPTLEDAKRTFAYIQGGLDHDEGYKPFYQVHEEAFDRMIAEVERAAAARALEEAAQSYPFTLMGVGATWHEAQKVLCERAAEIREGKNDG